MPDTSAFLREYDALNPRQREAVDAVEGPVMVIAGPGTGKTKVLTLRIANILRSTDTSPEAILALTFTDSGATEMRARLAGLIGSAAYRVTVTTFHSFCNDIIQQYPESFGALAGAAPLTDSDRAILLRSVLERTDGLELLRPAGAPDLYLHAAARAIDQLKREGVAPERLADIAAHEEAAVRNADDLYHEKGAHKGKMKGVHADALKQAAKLAELSVLYAAYQGALRTERAYDYSDMITEVARALHEDGQFRLMLQERYQYILVDEHQDTNNAQNRIVELLASFWERPNLFVVGDANQAIYRFQGASLENFLYFRSLYRDVRLIELQDNYRSTQAVLDAAHAIRPSGSGGLTARRGHPERPVAVLAMPDPDAERYAIVRLLEDVIAAGTAPESVAVLYRDNADGQALASLLDKRRVPYSISGDNDVLGDPVVIQLVTVLDAVAAYGEPGPLLAALAMPVLRVPPLDHYKLADFCRKGRNPYDVIAAPGLLHEAGIGAVARLTDIAGMLARWQGTARTEPTAAALETVVRESGVLEAALAAPDASQKLAKLHALYDLARSLVQRHRAYTLRDFIAHLAFIREHGLALTSGAGAPVPGRVRLMTAHRSKGLEFDHVIIAGATDDHWGPRGRRELIRLPDAVFLKSAAEALREADGDERNLFYVALTRARLSATVTYARRDTDGAELLPVRFLDDIKLALIERTDTAALERAWEEERELTFAAPAPRTPDLADRAFLNDAFRRQGLSVTALNNYLACPWRYFYTNLVRIPEAPAFPLMYGNAVDRALQEYMERYRVGEDPGRDGLLALFRRFAGDQPFQERQLADALTRGERALGAWWERSHAGLSTAVINQLRVPAVALPLDGDGDVILNGKMDRVDLLGDGTVVVTDYKTGKPKSRRELTGGTKDADGNYLRQLVFYNVLLDRFEDGKYRMVKGVLDFIEPDAKGAPHREEFVVSPEQKEELVGDIRRVAREILELAFWDRTCGERDCQYCRLRAIQQTAHA